MLGQTGAEGHELLISIKMRHGETAPHEHHAICPVIHAICPVKSNVTTTNTVTSTCQHFMRHMQDSLHHTTQKHSLPTQYIAL